MQLVTTNIRLSRVQYRKLKKEAFNRNISLASVIRERLDQEVATPATQQIEQVMRRV